jgi:hypothetical protein
MVETVTITMDDRQEQKYDHYVSQIEDILENPNPEGGQSYAILGLLARLSSVALHASLEDGYTYKTALDGGTVTKWTFSDGEKVQVSRTLPRPVYESPKLVECAKRVAASPHCGHIIFCEPTAVHQWMREVLVKHGIPRERIAILNAEETAGEDRIRIAREFNGLSSAPAVPGTCTRPADSTITPKYDVVIANSVAYEGVDLQVRTCSIHHLDLPWTPADLEQRNGRAVRQGNTLGTVRIFYYFADGSTDGYRFSLIDGKAGWLGELIKSQVRDTNNPAAQQQLTPEDILLMISRNKEKTRALLEDKKKRQAAEARARIAKESARVYRQAAGRFRDARQTTDAERAARLRDEGEQRLADLEQVNAEAWPWAPWMYAVRDTDVIIPEAGGAPVYEGLRVARARAGAPDQLDFLEFGQIVGSEDGDKIGLRAAGSPSWQLIGYTGLLAGSPITPGELPRDGGPMWPDDDDAQTQAAIEKKIGEVFRYAKFETLGWRGASDAWLERWWPRFEARITEGLAASFRGENVPVIGGDELAIATGSEIRGKTVVPPTRAGWQRFLELAPASDETYTSLREIGLSWWGRKIPQNLLSSAKEESSTSDAEDSEKQASPSGRFMSRQDQEALQKILDERGSENANAELTPEEQDKNILDNMFLQGEAMADAMAMGGLGRDARQKQRKAHNEAQAALVLVRTEALVLRARGYQVVLHGGVANPLLIIAKDGRLLAARRAPPNHRLGVSPELSPDDAERIGKELDDAHTLAVRIMREEHAKSGEGIEAVARGAWRRARALGPAGASQAAASAAASSPPPSSARSFEDERVRNAEKAEEERMGEALRSERDREEAQWADAVERGTTIEIKRGLAPVAARRAAIKNLGPDIKHYDKPERPFEEARSAIKALGLPPKKYAQYVRQAEEAITSGKSYEPVVERARKAKAKTNAATPVNPAHPPPPPTELDVVLETFNAEPRWRLGLQRRRPDGYVLVVFPERGSADEAVAAIDVIREKVEAVRWLDDRITSREQDAITERIERALWAASDAADDDAEEGEDDEAPSRGPSPIDQLAELMERRGKALGARPAASANLGRTDGFRQIAEALRDLAQPSGPPADQLEQWLESESLMAAAEVVGRARASDTPVRRVMSDLWDQVLAELPIVEIEGRPGALRVDMNAIFDFGGTTFLLERVTDGDRVSLRRVRVQVGERDDDDDTVAVEDATERLTVRAEVHKAERGEPFLVELYQKLGAFHADLVRAPKMLQDVRVLLYWAAVMLDAPLCQGDVKKRASAAFEQARAYYDTARRQIIEGRSVDAVRRMHAALGRISTAAAEIARSCGEGQIDIGVTPPHLPVRPEDKADVVGGTMEARP